MPQRVAVRQLNQVPNPVQQEVYHKNKGLPQKQRSTESCKFPSETDHPKCRSLWAKPQWKGTISILASIPYSCILPMTRQWAQLRHKVELHRKQLEHLAHIDCKVHKIYRLVLNRYHSKQKEEVIIRWSNKKFRMKRGNWEDDGEPAVSGSQEDSKCSHLCCGLPFP